MAHAHRTAFHTLSLGLALATVGLAAQAQQTVKMWSHWPDEASKRGFVEAQVKAFEAATPACKVDLQFIQKADLYTSAKTAVRTGQAPDIFWLEPDEIAFAKSGYLEPLDSYVELNNLEDWARRSWTYNGKVYGLPLEAYTVELYYNKDTLKKLGVTPPASMQFTQAEFTSVHLLANLGVHGAAAAMADPLTVIGDNGTLTLEGDTLHCSAAAPGQTARLRYDMPQCYADSCAATISHFLDALASGTDFETSPQDNLRTLRLVEDIYAQNPQP